EGQREGVDAVVRRGYVNLLVVNDRPGGDAGGQAILPALPAVVAVQGDQLDGGDGVDAAVGVGQKGEDGGRPSDVGAPVHLAGLGVHADDLSGTGNHEQVGAVQFHPDQPITPRVQRDVILPGEFEVQPLQNLVGGHLGPGVDVGADDLRLRRRRR